MPVEIRSSIVSPELLPCPRNCCPELLLMGLAVQAFEKGIYDQLTGIVSLTSIGVVGIRRKLTIVNEIMSPLNEVLIRTLYTALASAKRSKFYGIQFFLKSL